MSKIKSICKMEDIDEFSKIIKASYPYYAQYYHSATAGERTTYGNEYVTIAYGKTISELVILCEEKGFTPTQRLFDGGYRIKENPDYDKTLTDCAIIRSINTVLSKVFEVFS